MKITDERLKEILENEWSVPLFELTALCREVMAARAMRDRCSFLGDQINLRMLDAFDLARKHTEEVLK